MVHSYAYLPELRHPRPNDVNREAELIPPSRVVCIDLGFNLLEFMNSCVLLETLFVNLAKAVPQHTQMAPENCLPHVFHIIQISSSRNLVAAAAVRATNAPARQLSAPN